MISQSQTPQKTFPPTATNLFLAALLIGLTSFGGGMSAWLHREFVLRRGWMDEATFQSDFAIARVLPGTNTSNFLVIGGFRFAGLAGAVLGLVGVLVAPFLIVIAVAGVAEWLDDPLVGAFIEGVAAAAVGFLVPLTVRSVRQVGRDVATAAVIAAVAVAVGILDVPLAPAVAVALPLSVALAAWRRHRA